MVDVRTVIEFFLDIAVLDKALTRHQYEALLKSELCDFIERNAKSKCIEVDLAHVEFKHLESSASKIAEDIELKKAVYRVMDILTLKISSLDKPLSIVLHYILVELKYIKINALPCCSKSSNKDIIVVYDYIISE